jgi:hypothetical protein
MVALKGFLYGLFRGKIKGALMKIKRKLAIQASYSVILLLIIATHVYSNWYSCDGTTNIYVTPLSDTSVERAIGLTYPTANKDTIYLSDLKEHLLSIYNSYNYLLIATFIKDSALCYVSNCDTLGIYRARIDTVLKGIVTKDTLLIYNSSSSIIGSCHPDVATIGRRGTYLFYFNDFNTPLKLVEMGFSFYASGRPVCYTIQNDSIVPINSENTYCGLSITISDAFIATNINKNRLNAIPSCIKSPSATIQYTLSGKKCLINTNKPIQIILPKKNPRAPPFASRN